MNRSKNGRKCVHWTPWIAAAIMVAAGLALPAGTNAQITDNHEIRAVPVPSSASPRPGKVVMDGNLDGWDLSGAIFVCPDMATLGDSFIATVAMMYDADALYVGVQWLDPTPMVNNYDPRFDQRFCFQSDSLQLHFKTDIVRQIFGWYYTLGKTPAAIATDGESWAMGKEIKYIDGIKELGITEAFHRGADGKSYTQEMRIPWTAIARSGKAYQAGDSIECMLDLVWGPDSGKGWPVAHSMDLVKPNVVHTGWFWEVRVEDIRGKIILSPQGHLTPAAMPQRQTSREAPRPPGVLPIRATIPANATEFTLAINDANGRRVRNLAGDFAPEDYTVSAEGDRRVVEVPWDCLDDAGALVHAGEYRVIGLTRGPIKASYDMCFYNPGTPPWETADGAGGWGADHDCIHHVAASGDWVFLASEGAEGGCGIFGVGGDGRKKWSERRCARAMAADDRYLYFMCEDGWAQQYGLARLGATDGAYKPYLLDGKERFPLPLEEVFGQGAVPGKLTSMAVHGDTLVLGMSKDKVAVLDAATAKLRRIIDAPKLTALAFARDGTLWAVLDGKVGAFDLDGGAFKPLKTGGLGKAGAIAVDGAGNVLIFDEGPDSQVKAYSPAGKKVYTAGRRGGRPVRGTFDEQAMTHVNAVAVDGKGQIWVAESWNYPRRVSVWGKDGKLVRDYIGGTGYSGCAGYLHDSDPNLAYVGPIEILLDRARGTWKVTQVLWNPDASRGECFGLSTGSNCMPQRFTSDAGGKRHEYLFAHEPWVTGFCVYMEKGGKWQPVAAICAAGSMYTPIDHFGAMFEAPGGELAGCNTYDGVFWNDRNGDGKVQKSECEIIPARKNRNGPDACPLSLDNGWGGRMDKNLVIYASGIVRYRPDGFTEDGAPIYSSKGMEKLPINGGGDLVPVPEENLLLCLSGGINGSTTGMLGIEPNSGDIVWSYPNPYGGVPGSHHATMPRPGLLLGPLRILGVAKVNEQVGRVFMMRGNLGQDFFMTTDGLFVGSIFQDGRLPGESLPAREEQLYGMPMENFSGGGEPFNGWFGKQSDGKVRMVCGLPGQAAMIVEIKGLETIRRLKGPAIRLDDATIVKADQENGQAAMEKAMPKSYTINPAAVRFAIDGKADKWKDVPAISIQRVGQTAKGTARLAYDANNLYVEFEVADGRGWLNEGKDFTRLFKTGASVDVQLCVDAATAGDTRRTALGAGDLRIVLANYRGNPAAVLMKPIDAAAGSQAKVTYSSPVGIKTFARVEVLDGAKLGVSKGDGWYKLEAAIPLSAIGLVPRAGMVIYGDVGFITANAQGTENSARTYWANPNTNLVSDLPLEAWMTPAAWAELKFK